MGKEVGLGVYFYGKVDELLGQLEKVEQRVSKLNRRFATFDKGLEAVRAQTKGTVKEFGNFTKAQDWIDKSFTKGSVAHKQYTSTLKQVEGALTKQAAVIRASGGDWKKFINNSDRLISTQKVMAGELKVTKKGLEAVGTATKTSGKQFDTYGKQIGRVKGGIEKFTAAMKVTAAYSLATGVIYGLVHAITDAVSAIIDYDQALKNLQAITSATDAQMLIMGKTIKEVASTTKYSVSEVAEAAILLGQAGFTAEESVDGIRAVALLATGTLTDMSTSADLVTTAVRAFGLQATDTSKIADIFASAVNRSKLTIDKIRTAFNYIGPVAHKAGLSLEETAAGAMLLANTGLRASTIGTGFRQVLSRLIAPTDRLRTAFVAAGADLSKLNPQMSSMESIIEELTKVVPNAQRAFELFGLRGAAAVSAFTEAGVEGYRAMIKEVYRVGVAQQMANKQMEGLGVMSKNLADKLGLLAVAIGEGGVAFAIRLFLKVARPMVDLLTVLADSTVGRVTVAVAFLTAGILALKVASTYLIVQLSALVLGYTALEVKMMVAAKGSGLITVATTALTTAFKKLWAVMAANPWVAIVSAIGLVVVSIATYIEKLSNLTIEIEANIIEINKQVKSLEAYRKQLNNTEKGSVEYIAVLQRLLNDYPELKKHVDLATMSFRDEGKALDKLIQSTYDKKLSSMIDLYEEYGNKVQRAQVKTVLWGSLVENVSRQFELMGFSLEGVGKAWDKVSSWVGNAVDYILGGIASLSKETQKIEALTIQQTDALKNLADEMKGYGVVAGASIATITAVLEKHTDMSVSEVRKMASAIQAYLNESAESALKNAELVGSLGSAWAEIYQKVDESRKQDILNEYKAFNEREALYFKDALAHAESGADKNETEKKYKEESEARLKEMLATIVKRENIVVDLKKTSMERQLDLIDVLLEQEQQKYDLAFVNLLVAKQKELSAVENNEVKKLEVVAKYKELETQLSNDSFSVMTALSEKKVSLIKDINAKSLRNTAEYFALVKELADRSHNELVELLGTRLKKELIAISEYGLSEKEVLLAKYYAHVAHNEKISKEHDRHFKELTQLANETYDGILLKVITSGESAEKQEKEILEAKKQRNEEIKQLYEDRSQAYKAVIDNLISEEERLTSAIRTAQEERDKIVQTGDDLIRELNYKLMTDLEEWNSEKIRADELLAQSNEELQNGNITRAGEYATEARSIYNGLAKEVKDESGKTIMSVGETVDIAVEGVTKSTEALQNIFSEKIGVFKTELTSVRDRIQETERAFSKFKQEIASFNKQAKLTLDVTPTLKALSKAKSAVDSYIAKLNSIPKRIVTAIVTKRVSIEAKEGGLITEPAHMAFGGKVPGSGAGDIVPAMLEPGEFVEPKSTVKEYGSGIFEALRSRMIPKSKVHALVPSIKMAAGGGVPTKLEYLSNLNPDIDPSNLLTGGQSSADAYSPSGGLSSKDIFAYTTELKQIPTNIVTALVAPVEEVMGDVSSYTAALKAIPNNIISAITSTVIQSTAEIMDYLKSLNKIPTDVDTSITASTEQVTGDVNAYTDELQGVPTDVGTSFTASTENATSNVNNYDSILTRIPRNVVTSFISPIKSVMASTGIYVNKLNEIPKVVNTDVMVAVKAGMASVNSFIHSLNKIPRKIITVLSTVQGKQGGGLIAPIRMAFGGGVPGSGTGDTVPTMLESGEFVEPKSVVKEYGIDLFEALRAKLIPKGSVQSLLSNLKMQTGGVVSSFRRASIPVIQRMQAGGEVQSKGNLYTIKFAIGNESHQLYGEEDSINSLVNNLRRSQLVTV